MADKELKSIRFPGLDNRYIVPEGGTGGSGQDGYSPAAKVEATADGAKITITDKTGTTEAEVKNGKDGSPGADGAPGAKGDPGDDYVLTDADKTEIAAEVIAGGVEAELGEEPLPAPASAAIGQIVKVKSVDENGKITQTEAVDMPSGGGSPSSALICDITLAEAAQAVSQTLEHNFYALHCIVNCGTSGVALLVDADGASVSGKINLMLDTTVASYNIRKYGLISYNAAEWKSYAIHAIWSPDRTFFKQSQFEELSTGESSTVYHSFGGVTAMKGTLGADALSPDSGRTVNIVAPANTLLNAGVRVIIWGEYYE